MTHPMFRCWNTDVEIRISKENPTTQPDLLTTVTPITIQIANHVTDVVSHTDKQNGVQYAQHGDKIVTTAERPITLQVYAVNGDEKLTHNQAVAITTLATRILVIQNLMTMPMLL